MASANGGIIGPNNDPTGVPIPAKPINAVTPYTADGYWRAAPDTSAVCLLVVGGGGGGGSSGGGGFRNLTSITYPTAGVPITVGAGGPDSGPGDSRAGGDSEFGGTTPYASSGGGAYRNPGGSGGSGFRNNGQPVPSVAAPCGSTPCGLGNIGGYSPSEGNSGGITVCSQAGAGGGGAGGRGNDMPGEGASGEQGGPGSSSSITGSPVTYAGGGAGGGNPVANWYPSGNPWGRTSAPPSPGGGGGSSGSAGTDGLGGGAGSGPGTPTGGSGIVIVKENNPTPQPASTFVTTASGVWSLQGQFALKKADQWTS